MAKQLELRKDREAFTSYTKSPAKSSGGELLKLACEYKDPKWTNNRFALIFCGIKYILEKSLQWSSPFNTKNL